MSSFDPYYVWLSIPPAEQPPHHYRLLGVTEGEADPDVIDNAAEQRMAFLRSKQNGARADWGQRLLNEVAAARACLLNPETKAAYDRSLPALQKRTEPQIAAPTPSVPMTATAPSLSDLDDAFLTPVAPPPSTSGSPGYGAPPRGRADKNNSGLVIVLSILGLSFVMVLVCGGMIWYALSSVVQGPPLAGIPPGTDPGDPYLNGPPPAQRPPARPPNRVPPPRPTPSPGGGAVDPSTAPGPAPPGNLKLIAADPLPELKSVCDVELSPDDTTLWTAAFNTKTVSMFARDRVSGELSWQASLTDDRLSGVTGVSVSPAGNVAATASFRSKSIGLVYYDSANRELKLVSSFDGSAGQLRHPISPRFSPDGRFVYALDSQQIAIFAVEGAGSNSSLRLVEMFSHPSIRDSRDLVFHNQRNKVFICCNGSDTVLQVDRDVETGKLTNAQAYSGFAGLDGVFGAAIDESNNRLYTVSGRFGGDQAICSFDVSSSLRPISVTKSDSFRAGNKIAFDPDRGFVYATASDSGAVAVLTTDSRGNLALRQMLVDPAACAGGAGLALTGDRQFLYVADEKEGRISVLKTPR